MYNSRLYQDPDNRRIIRYIVASVRFYGYVTTEEIVDTFNYYNPKLNLTLSQLNTLLDKMDGSWKSQDNIIYIRHKNYLLRYVLFNRLDENEIDETIRRYDESRRGLSPYRPIRTTFVAHENHEYVDTKDVLINDLLYKMKWVVDQIFSYDYVTVMFKKMAEEIYFSTKISVGTDDPNKVIRLRLSQRTVDKLLESDKFKEIFDSMFWNTRCVEKYGHTRAEAKKLQNFN